MENKTLEYRVNNQRFETKAEAVKYVFEQFGDNNLNALSVLTVELFEPTAFAFTTFMNAIDCRVLDTMTILGPASYK